MLKRTSKVLFVSHDASRTGAPILLLNFLKWLKENTEISFITLLKQGGVLEPEFRTFWIWFSLKYPDNFTGKLVENPEIFDPNNLKFFSEIWEDLRNILQNDPQKYPNDCKNAFMIDPRPIRIATLL